MYFKKNRDNRNTDTHGTKVGCDMLRGLTSFVYARKMLISKTICNCKWYFRDSKQIVTSHYAISSQCCHQPPPTMPPHQPGTVENGECEQGINDYHIIKHIVTMAWDVLQSVIAYPILLTVLQSDPLHGLVLYTAILTQYHLLLLCF